MRKMTKTAVTLAAMSAMTVASASLAFAAVKEEANISAIDNTEAPVDTSASGEWGGDAVKGYTFTKSDGTKLKDQWAEIDGTWYYFDGEKIVRNNFKVLDDKGYFFDENGRLATGWQKITSKMDAYSEIDIPDELYNQYLNSYTTVDETKEYDYHDFVWCYFDEHGIAKENEWFQDWTGLWYYFDGNAMVKNVYNYPVHPENYDATDSQAEKVYGFDEEGRMLVGWNNKKLDKKWNNPTTDEAGKIWYYYKPNGQMQSAGWASIDGKWYLFANTDADGAIGKGEGTTTKWSIGGNPLIVNSYVASYPTRTSSKPEYFYVNGKGELVSGIANVKKAYKVVFYTQEKDIHVAYEALQVKDSDIYVNFADNNYAAKEGVVANQYYLLDNKDTATVKYTDLKGGVYEAVGSITTDKDAAALFTFKNPRWVFTDQGDVVIDPSAISNYDKANVVTYRMLTFKTEAATSGTKAVTKADGAYVIIPKSVEDEKKVIADAKTAKDKYNTEYNEYETARDNYLNESVTDAVSNSGVAGVTGYDDSYSSVTGLDDMEPTDAVTSFDSLNSVLAELKRAETAKKKAEEYATSMKKVNASVAAVSAAEAEAVSAGLYVDALNKVKDIVEEMVKYTTAYDEYKVAAEEYDTAERALSAAQSAVAFQANYYIDHDGNTTTSIAVSGQNAQDFTVVGERVKNAFIGRSKKIYMADSDSNLVANKAVLISKTANIVQSINRQPVDTFQNAYIVFTPDGSAAKDYAANEKSITISGVTYWSTNETIKLGDATATVFVSNKAVDGKK